MMLIWSWNVANTDEPGSVLYKQKNRLSGNSGAYSMHQQKSGNRLEVGYRVEVKKSG
jgi:hypothetical protein